MTKPEDKPRPPAVGTPLDGRVVPLAPMEQLLAFCDWERKHNPHPEGKPHVAEWAALQIERQAEALRRLRAWGGLDGNFSVSVALPVIDWIDGGMASDLPALPEWVAVRERHNDRTKLAPAAGKDCDGSH